MNAKPPTIRQPFSEIHEANEPGCEPRAELEQFYATAPLGLAMLDRDLRYLRVNARLAAINGVSIEEHIGRCLHEVRPDIAPQVEAYYRRVIETGEAILNVEVVGSEQSHSDRQTHYLVSYHPLKSADGEVRGVSAVVQDITEAKAAERAVQDRVRFESLLANLSSTFVNLRADDLDARIAQWLGRLVDFLGVDRSAILRFSEDRKSLVTTHSYAVEGVETFRGMLPVERFRWYHAMVLRGEPFGLGRLPDGLPEEAAAEREYCLQTGFKSNLVIPLVVGGEVLGVVGFGSLRQFCSWPDDLVQRLKIVGQVFANAFQRQRTELELARLRNRLELENLYLREEIQTRQGHEHIVGQSATIRRVLSQVEQVAPTDSTVLLLGETGTGKELVANAIHNLSTRKDRPMVRVNCAALPATLIESELFGREKGAYTGALSKQIGRFEIADGSTLFLDEIAELPTDVQAKLLRVLQDRQFERLGGTKTIHVDVRLIAATNRDLDKAVREGRFREDVYYRLNVFPITVPPLRDHIEDLPELVWAFVDELSRKTGRSIDAIPKECVEALQRYAWPGNVRELRNLVERSMIASKGPTLRIDIPLPPSPSSSTNLTLENVAREHILRILKTTRWRIRGPGGAAEILGMKPTTLDARMAKLGINRRESGSHIS